MKVFMLFGVVFLVSSSLAQNLTCRPGQFPCPNSDLCVSVTFICDGERDCPGGEDEGPPCPPCPGFQCNDGKCIPASWECDYVDDCSGKEDEGPRCPPPPCRGYPYEFECSDGECINADYVCDGKPDCVEGDDEAAWCYPCPEFQCSDGTCIPESSVCDGNRDCPDGIDEYDCTMAAVPAVPFKRISMTNNGQEEKNRKPTRMEALSKRRTKKSQKQIRGEGKNSSFSRRSLRKSKQ